METKVTAPKVINTIAHLIKMALVILLIMWNLNVFSQDSIFKFDNTILQGKVLEISDIEIRYKKLDFTEGPTYVADKYDVSFIKYSNGMIDSFPEVKPWFRKNKKTTYDTIKIVNNISPYSLINDNKIKIQGGNYNFSGQYFGYRKMGDYLLANTNDRQIKGLLLKAEQNRKNRYVGFLAIPLGVVGALAAVSESDATYFLLGAVGAGACVGITITNHKNQKDNIRKAVKLYNQKF